MLNNFKTFRIKVICGKEGKKDIIYPPGWQTDTPDYDKIGGIDTTNATAIRTGSISGVTVVDVDSPSVIEEVKKQFDVLLETAGLIIKTKRGFHFYFSYEPSVKTTSNYRGIKGLDIRNDGGNVIYKIDDDAHVKCADYKVIRNDPLTGFPKALIQEKPVVRRNDTPSHSFNKRLFKYPLATLVKSLFSLDVTMIENHLLNDTQKAAFRRLSPSDFRNGAKGSYYKDLFDKKGFLTPLDIMDGDGSEYLSKVATILAVDETVDNELFRDVIVFLNDLWPSPMDERRLFRTIIDKPFIDESFKYNPDWTLNYKNKDDYYIFLNPDDERYYIINKFSGVVRSFGSKSTFTQAHLSMFKEKPDFENLKLMIVTFNPNKPKTFNDDAEEFYNTFNETPLLSLAKKREKPKKEPKFILNIIKNVIPDYKKRELFLKWLGYWVVTRKKSRVAWVFTSVHGSGKSTITDYIIGKIFGEQVSALNVGSDRIEETYNGFLKDKLFVSFNEINTLTKDRYKNRNKLKSLITESTFQLREMRRNPVIYPNYANFIFSSNDKIPLDIEEGDRRYNIVWSDRVLKNQPFFKEVGEEKYLDKINEELPDFVRYISSLPLNEYDYHRVIEDELKKQIVEVNKSFLDSFVSAMKKRDLNFIAENIVIDEDEERELNEIIAEWKGYFKAGYIPSDMVLDFYKKASGSKNITKHRITKYLKLEGFTHPTKMLNGKAVRVYEWPKNAPDPILPDDDKETDKINTTETTKGEGMIIEVQDKDGKVLERKKVDNRPAFDSLSDEDLRQEFITTLLEKGVKKEEFKDLAEFAKRVGFDLKTRKDKIRMLEGSLDTLIAEFRSGIVIDDEEIPF